MHAQIRVLVKVHIYLTQGYLSYVIHSKFLAKKAPKQHSGMQETMSFHQVCSEANLATLVSTRVANIIGTA